MADVMVRQKGRIRGLVRKRCHADRMQREHSIDDGTLEKIRRRVLRWGRSNFQVYPWRFERDPWLSFVAEFLLQRTRAIQVAGIFGELRRHLSTVDAVAMLDAERAKFVTNRLGLHRRGVDLVDIAKEVVDRGGALPESMEELCELSGVGMYTGAAWLSLHRGKRAVIVDANICRWLSRMTGLPYSRDPRHVRWVQELADDLTPRRVFRDYNYAVLDFTMNICKTRNPLCQKCVLRDDCRYSKRRM